MRVLLVSALRDEGPHVLEWIAHHAALGVTDFLLFTNDCDDGTDKILDALSAVGVVHLENRPEKGKSIQWSALKAAWGHALRKRADWVLCIDCDEFLNLRAPLTCLADLIRSVPEADAITLPWRLFGHNGHLRAPDALTVEAFGRAAPERCDYPVTARQFKTLFRARGPFRQIGVHRPRLKKDATARWVDGSGKPMPEGFAQAEHRINLYGLPTATQLVQLNHYSLRSAESFLLKQQRGLPNRKSKPIDLAYWVERNFNTVEDLSILRHAPALKARLAELRALPGVAELEQRARQHHRAAFKRLIRDEANVRLLGRLMLAASSTPPSAEVSQQLVALYRASNGA